MSCLQCPHCIAQGRFGLVDENDPALRKKVFTGYIGRATSGEMQEFEPYFKKIHKSKSSTFSMCGRYAFRYKDRRSGSGINNWDNVTCRDCLKMRPGAK